MQTAMIIFMVFAIALIICTSVLVVIDFLNERKINEADKNDSRVTTRDKQ